MIDMQNPPRKRGGFLFVAGSALERPRR